MSDYSSLATSQSAQSFSQSSAFAAALQKAKQIAAKIHPGGQSQGTKRSIEDSLGEPDSKKFGSSDYPSPNTSMSPAAMQAVQQAAAVAARLAQSGGNTINEEVRLPDKLAAMLSGRTGSDDHMARLQMESNCKIQMSRDSERQCTLSGSREVINRAKDIMTQLCMQHNCGGTVDTIWCVLVPPSGVAGYPPYQEVMVPGAKVGLVIGKGGETIKMLQEKTGAKMVIIQEGPGQEVAEKPLRISGDPAKVEHAKQLVFDLILEKDGFNNRAGGGGFNGGAAGGGGGGSGGGGETTEVFVPKNAVGVVIGKGGDMIKKIQGETGCKLQFIQGKGDGPGDRRCIITGSQQQVEDAKRTIEELIESVMRGTQGMNRGNNMNNTTNSNYGYGTDAAQGPMREEVSFSVPASKCGIVIGRGGETIKLINQQSGAFCEMDRSAINPPSEKIFKMKGTTEQIEHARQLISEKIGIDVAFTSTRQIGTGPPSQGNYGNSGGGMQGNANSYSQQWGGGGYQQQQSWDQSQQQQQGQLQGAAGGQADYSSQWIEYYKSMGMMREAEMIEQQLKAKQGGQPAQGLGNPTANGAGVHAGGMGQQHQQQQQQPSMQQGGAGQQDYSKQWAEYYRSVGKIEEAEAIEKQMKAAQQPQMGGGSVSAATPGNAAPVAGGYPAAAAAAAAAAAQGMAGYNQYAQYYGGGGGGQQPGYPQAYGGYGGYQGQGPPQPPQQPGGPPQGNDKN